MEEAFSNFEGCPIIFLKPSNLVLLYSPAFVLFNLKECKHFLKRKAHSSLTFFYLFQLCYNLKISFY